MDYELDTEEQEIVTAFERGELKPLPDAEQKIKEAEQTARNTVERMKQIPFTLTERDLHLVYAKAAEHGVSCQIMLSNIIHKYLTGQLIEKKQTEIAANSV